jgi:Spy/CpxP family protein refolding chaperone
MTFVRPFRCDWLQRSSLRAIAAVLTISLLIPATLSAVPLSFSSNHCVRHPARAFQDGNKGKKQIDQLKKLKLIEALNLDDATAEKFFLRYNSEQKKVDEARKSLDDTMHDLEKAKTSGNAEKIKQLNQQILDKHKALQDASSEMLRSVREVLNDKQYADFLVFEAKFQEQIRKILLDSKREGKRE